MQMLIEKIEAEKSPIGSMEDLLIEIARMIDADHAEISTWQFSGVGGRLLTRRFVFDPHALKLPLAPLPADERPQMRASVHTWVADDAAPGRGGPALLSARTCDDHQVVLLALRRSSRRGPFIAREAVLLNALNHCIEFCDAIQQHTPPTEPPQ